MSYILISGASAGLGTCFARQLAAEKKDLILVARRGDRLEALASELSEKFGIAVKIIAADLSELSVVSGLAKGLKAEGTKLSGLINNAGYGTMGDFKEGDLSAQVGMIELNVTSLIAMTHALLPLFEDHGERFIINVGSVASFFPLPSFAVYAASKAAVLSFSDALGSELAEDGITVSALCPGPTSTEFMDVAGIPEKATRNINFMTADEVVRQSLAERDQPIVITGKSNRRQVLMGKFMPKSFIRKQAMKRRRSRMRYK